MLAECYLGADPAASGMKLPQPTGVCSPGRAATVQQSAHRELEPFRSFWIDSLKRYIKVYTHTHTHVLYIYTYMYMLDVMVYTCNLNTQEAEAGGSRPAWAT
jgi:hypothetical protein